MIKVPYGVGRLHNCESIKYVDSAELNQGETRREARRLAEHMFCKRVFKEREARC